MSTELSAVTQAVAEFDRVAAGLADLSAKYGNVVYDVTTPKGMSAARAARAAVREPRYEVERIRKAAKAPIIALGKKLDSEAARITWELEKLESPIAAVITAEEDRKEREKQAKIDAELKRVGDIHTRIDQDIRGAVGGAAGRNSTQIERIRVDIERIVIDESFEEFRQTAAEAREAALGRLTQMYTDAVAHEAEQARIKAEREELGRLREAQALRDAEAKARRDDEEREAKKVRDAEAARHAEQLRKQREEQEAAAKIERDQLAAERAELTRQQEAQRKIQQPAPSVAPLTRAGTAVQIPTAAEIVDVLSKHYRVHPDTIREWLYARLVKEAA